MPAGLGNLQSAPEAFPADSGGSGDGGGDGGAVPTTPPIPPQQPTTPDMLQPEPAEDTLNHPDLPHLAFAGALARGAQQYRDANGTLPSGQDLQDIGNRAIPAKSANPAQGANPAQNGGLSGVFSNIGSFISDTLMPSAGAAEVPAERKRPSGAQAEPSSWPDAARSGHLASYAGDRLGDATGRPWQNPDKTQAVLDTAAIPAKAAVGAVKAIGNDLSTMASPEHMNSVVQEGLQGNNLPAFGDALTIATLGLPVGGALAPEASAGMLAGHLPPPTWRKAMDEIPIYVDPTTKDLGEIMRNPNSGGIGILHQTQGGHAAAFPRNAAMHDEVLDWLLDNGYPHFDPSGQGNGIVRGFADNLQDAKELIKHGR